MNTYLLCARHADGSGRWRSVWEVLGSPHLSAWLGEGMPPELRVWLLPPEPLSQPVPLAVRVLDPELRPAPRFVGGALGRKTNAVDHRARWWRRVRLFLAATDEEVEVVATTCWSLDPFMVSPELYARLPAVGSFVDLPAGGDA